MIFDGFSLFFSIPMKETLNVSGGDASVGIFLLESVGMSKNICHKLLVARDGHSYT